MVKGELLIGAVAEKVGRDGEIVSLLRPCVDCGLVTGSFCEANCFAEDWLGSEVEEWNDNQFTPHCTHCEAKYKFCHFCLGKDWVTPEPHYVVKIPSREQRMDEILRQDAVTRSAMSHAMSQTDTLFVRGTSGDTSSSSDDAHLPELDSHVYIVHNHDGVIPLSPEEILARSETPPRTITRHSS